MSTYYLKYFAEIMNFRGQLARVEILQRDTQPATVLEIGDVRGLELEIQGGQDDVFTPIVKTQARLSMISSDDKPTADGVKYGDWGEFYTPDATLYKMVIKTKASAASSSWETRWTGYITPDSWQEGLEYRSAITITARDNIGHLQDFEFDMTGADSYGLVSIRSIINAAMTLIALPMTLSTNTGPEDLEADGVSVLDSMVNLSKFAEDDWYTVLEDLLDSIGYTLRFTDNNRVTLAPIRSLPLCGESSQATAPALDFFGGDGSIVPAAKVVIEEDNYDYKGEVPLPIKGDFSFNLSTYHCYVFNTKSPIGMYGVIDNAAAPFYKLQAQLGTVWQLGSDFYSPANPAEITLMMEGQGWNDYVFLAANGYPYENNSGIDTRAQSLKFRCGTPDVTLRFYFHRSPMTSYYKQSTPQLNGLVPMCEVFGEAGLKIVKYTVSYKKGNTTRYWSAEEGWVETEAVNEMEYDPAARTTNVEITLGQCADIPADGDLTFTFVDIEYMMTGLLAFAWDSPATGCYARLSSVTVEPNAVNLSKNTVRLYNNEKFNVTISRKPAVAQLSREVPFAFPSSYGAALFYYPTGDDYPRQYPYKGKWSGAASGAVDKPLPVLIGQEILCYRGASLWELSGNCAPQDGSLFRFDTVLGYKARTYILMSGTLDFTSGTVSGVILREFLDYDDLWDDTQQGEWTDTGDYNTVGGDTGGGGGGAGSTGGGGSYQNFFELDGDGNVKLKDIYGGLWTSGFLTAGGRGSGGGGGGGASVLDMWKSLTNNASLPSYDDNTKIAGAHIPIGTGLTLNAQTGLIDVDNAVISAYTKAEVDAMVLPLSVSLADIEQRAASIEAWIERPVMAEAYVQTLNVGDVINGTAGDSKALEGHAASYFATASAVTALQDNFDGSGNAKAALKLTTVSKTAWGRTYWTASGVPDSISGDMSDVGNVIPSANNTKALGSTAKMWSAVYAKRIYLDSGVYLEYSSDDSGVELVGAGLFTSSYLTAGGRGSGGGGGGGGASVLDVWKSLTNNGSLLSYDSNTKIAGAHIPIGSGLVINSQTGLIDVDTQYIGSYTKQETDAMILPLAGAIAGLESRAASLEAWVENPVMAEAYIQTLNVGDVINGTASDSQLLEGHAASHFATASALTAEAEARAQADNGLSQSIGTLQGYFDNSGNAKAALKLTTVSKTAWGQTYWTSGGVPDSISGNMSNVGDVIPESTNAKALGSTAKMWAAVYSKRVYLADGVYLEYSSQDSGVELVGAGLFTSSYLTAGGRGSGGGGGGLDLGAMWTSLRNTPTATSDVTTTTLIATAHLPIGNGLTVNAQTGLIDVDATVADTWRIELDLASGIANVATRVASLEEWVCRPAFEELYAWTVNADKLNLSGTELNAADGILNYGGAALFSGLTNSGNDLSVTIGGKTRTVTPAYASNAGTLGGTAKGDLFTVLENSSSQLSITIGGTNKKLTVAYATAAQYDNQGYVITSTYETISDHQTREKALAEGIATALARLASLEAWTASPYIEEATAWKLNVEKAVNLGGEQLSTSGGVLYMNSAELFSNLSNSGTSLSITVGGKNRTLTVAYATQASLDGNGANIVSTYYRKDTALSTEKALCEGLAYASARLTGLEEWVNRPMMAEAYIDTLNGGQINVSGEIWSNTGMASAGYMTAGGVHTASDARLKKNRKDIHLSISQIADAPAIEFEWSDVFQGHGAGTIAQYWEEILPYNVQHFHDDLLTLEYGNAAMICVINLARELKKALQRIDELETNQKQ